MFDNIGSKIKTVATTLTALGIALSVLAGIVILCEGDASGLFIMIFGSLFSWLGSFLLYGFGQLIENTDKIAARLGGDVPTVSPPVTPKYTPVYHPSIDEPLYPPATPADWVCFSCGNTNFHRVHTCQVCGVTKHWSDKKHAEASSSIGFK
jgi:hypothetical protein